MGTMMLLPRRSVPSLGVEDPPHAEEKAVMSLKKAAIILAADADEGVATVRWMGNPASSSITSSSISITSSSSGIASSSSGITSSSSIISITSSSSSISITSSSKSSNKSKNRVLVRAEM